MAFPKLLIQPFQAAPDGGFVPVQVRGKGQLGGRFQRQGIGYQGAGIQGQAGFGLGQEMSCGQDSTRLWRFGEKASSMAWVAAFLPRPSRERPETLTPWAIFLPGDRNR